jgi:hypothetical protein
MATTYTLISSVTVGSGGAANIEFTSIPATYTDLLMKISSRGTGTNALGGYYYDVTFNNTSANRTGRHLLKLQNTPSSGIYTLWGLSSPTDFTASTFSDGELYIPNYGSSNYKSAQLDSVNENNSSTQRMVLSAGLWSDAAAITSIKLVQGNGDFAQYSTAYLYGISNA